MAKKIVRGNGFKDMTGQRFNMLTVLGLAFMKNGRSYWLCRCDCGTEKPISGDHFKSGRQKSCGCHKNKLASTRMKRHGLSDSSEHNIWLSMKQRCEKPTNTCFNRYGGRGIKVCERWRESFEVFYADMGPRPSTEHSIDRIDNNGDYCPENCRWATKTEQALNKRSNRRIEWRGRTMTISEWAQELGIRCGVLTIRLNSLGWSVERAFTTPLRKWPGPIHPEMA